MSDINKQSKRIIVGCLLGLCAWWQVVLAQDIKFEHFKTGFPLEGLHKNVECEDCHNEGIFRGTPMICEGCHSDRGPVTASTKSVDHINSSDRCDNCHTLQGWEQVVRTDHSDVRGSCFTCHAGANPPGTPKNDAHVESSDNCELCHSTNFFAPVVRFDHDDPNVVGKPCQGCHNGIIAEGKTPDHMRTVQDCGYCHTQIAWIPDNFTHPPVGGRCDGCHVDGGFAAGVPDDHPPTGELDCSACHSITSWLPLINGGKFDQKMKDLINKRRGRKN